MKKLYPSITRRGRPWSARNVTQDLNFGRAEHALPLQIFRSVLRLR